ncbi:MAG TPA: AAA family ATPase [Acetobacteraceae bacterium]|nr:AAA family ATPase [Acetobacteraceae bacterium]
MTAPPEQAEVVAFLRGVAGSDALETHISLVFVGADTVWKLKKAVRLAFLDFTSPEARQRFTQRELELNRPTAPGLYRDVVPVVRRADGTLGFGEADELPVVDWVLRMAPVPASDFLDVIAVARGLTPELLDALGDAVAAFHHSLPPATGTDVVAAMRHVANGNAQSACHAGLAEDAVQGWQTRILGALDAIAPWLTQRERDGFIRRAHGDLHLGNLCLWQGRPVPFDALEFDEAMATIDLGYDLAFLLMDLDRRVSRAAANRVLNRYVARTGDAALTRGLPAFLSLRAMVRAHVEARRGNRDIAAHYLSAAATYLVPKPAFVLAIGGLPGSGKSTLARAVAPELGNSPGALVLRSDEIRKRQHGAAPEERLPQSAYTDAASEAVFAALAALVRETSAGGHAVVADATFIDPRHRAMIEAAARAAGVPFIGLWLEAPLAELEARLAARRRDASDATITVLRAASRSNPQAGDWVAIDATEATGAQNQTRSAIGSVI